MSYNNKKISIRNYNKPNFDNLINAIDYIEKALILYKKKPNIKFTIKSLEFHCKCTNEYIIELKTLIKALHLLGYRSITDTFIYLIKINNNDLTKQYEPVLKYRFQSITEEPLKENIKRSENKSSYYIENLYSKPKHL